MKILSATIQMNADKQYYPMMLFAILANFHFYLLVLFFKLINIFIIILFLQKKQSYSRKLL